MPGKKQMVATCRALVIKDGGGTGGVRESDGEGKSEIMSSGGSVKLQRNWPFIQGMGWIVNSRVVKKWIRQGRGCDFFVGG